MIPLIDLSASWVISASLVLSRVTGLLLVAPVLGKNPVPRTTRALLTLVLTALLAPNAMPSQLKTTDGVLGALCSEVVLGVGIGLAIEFLFASVDVAGQLLSFSTGMSYINTVDPNSPVRATSFATFQFLIATLMFLSVDGHLLMITALKTSFTVVPIGTVALPGLAAAVIAASGSMLGFGLTLAAPTLLLLLLVDLCLGLAGRVAPQLQALLIGMGLKPLTGFIGMSLVFAALPKAFNKGLEAAALQIGHILTAAVGV